MQRFTHRIKRLLALSPGERGILLTSSVLLPLFWLALRVLGLKRFGALLVRRPLHAEPQAAIGARSLAGLVNTAARHSPLAATCLTRSLLLVWLLRRRGIASDLRIGVRFVQGTLEAHAWVECDGVPVNDEARVAQDFAAFDKQIPAWAFHTP